MVDKLLIRSQDSQTSFDLGWLLRNDQINDEQLCSYLLTETNAEIERLVSRFLQSPAERAAAVDQILFTVLQRRRLYKSNMSGKAWLFRLILAECMARGPRGGLSRRQGIDQVLQAIDTHFLGEGHFHSFLNSLDELQRLYAVFYFGHNLSADEIAVVLKTAPEPVRAGLEQVRELLMVHRRACEDCETHHSTLMGMETALLEALQPKDFRDETAEESHPERTGLLLGRLARERTSQSTRKWASRVFEAGLVVLLLVTGAWVFNQPGLFERLVAEPTTKAAVEVAVSLPTPQPVPTAAPVPNTAPMVMDEDAEKVLSLALASLPRWHSLWADVQVKTYLVENYSDGSGSLPGVSLRKQIWLNLPSYSRVIRGPSLGSPDSTYSVYRGRISGQDFDNGQPIEGPAYELIPDEDLKNLFFPNDIHLRGGRLTQMGSDRVAERPAWVLDWSIDGRKLYRYWIDQDYGVVLRRLEYDNSKFQPVFSEFTVTKIYYDTGFSAAIYLPDRYKGDHFASDFSGIPEIQDLKSGLLTWSNPRVQVPLTGTTAADRFSLAGSHLSFFNGPANWKQNAGGPPMMVLFSDKFDLSKLPLGGKSILACERSPDGSQVAYNSPPQESSGDTALMVVDLAAIQSARPVLPDGITSGDFAFSPDGRLLAFFGCEKTSGFCGIFVLDQTSGKLTRLLPLSYADYITWSPDGHSIALVGNDDTSKQAAIFSTANLLASEMNALLHTWHFQVIDAASGSVTYKKQFDWFNLNAPSDSPTHRWDQPFKIPTPGVKGCTNPPGATRP